VGEGGGGGGGVREGGGEGIRRGGGGGGASEREKKKAQLKHPFGTGRVRVGWRRNVPGNVEESSVTGREEVQEISAEQLLLMLVRRR